MTKRKMTSHQDSVTLTSVNSISRLEWFQLRLTLNILSLENISHDQLWSILKPEERERFMKALNDPSSELAQQLLASDELEKQRIEPWWEDNDAKLDEQSSSGSSNLVQRKYGARPGLVSIPEAVVSASAKSLDQGPSLLYNIIATL